MWGAFGGLGVLGHVTPHEILFLAFPVGVVAYTCYERHSSTTRAFGYGGSARHEGASVLQITSTAHGWSSRAQQSACSIFPGKAAAPQSSPGGRAAQGAHPFQESLKWRRRPGNKQKASAGP